MKVLISPEVLAGLVREGNDLAGVRIKRGVPEEMEFVKATVNEETGVIELWFIDPEPFSIIFEKTTEKT